ncbi:MAG: VOC family protein [Proteobacteria bacterium]|nr:VOC family protein [Pseudomonadota bacterium]
MPGGPDHIVHIAGDLDALSDIYTRAGFTVGVRNRHPFGTHNRIIQLDEFYFELLAIAEPERIQPHGPQAFSFGAYNRDFLKLHEGLSMLLLKSSDAAADAKAFDTAGIGGFKPFDFAREGKRPDGSVVKLAFSLAFAQDRASPNVRFAVCQHHYPENFWNRAFQKHANGAKRLLGVVLVAERPADHVQVLKALAEGVAPGSDADGIAVQTPNGEIAVVKPAAFHARFGVAPAIAGEGMTLNALRMSVADLDATAAVLRAGGVAAIRHGDCLVVPPAAASGATLVFEAA